MTADLPGWTWVRERMLARKPALRCTAYGLGKPHAVTVTHDGNDGWQLDDGHGTPGPALSWARSAIEPSRYANMRNARGDVLRCEREGSRDAVVVDIHELRRPGGPPLRTWVDEATGAILRMERVDDPAPIVLVLDLTEHI